MKGKIEIEFKFKKDTPEKFTKKVNINGITPFHIASAITTLIEILEKHADEHDQREILELLNKNAKFTGINIIPKGDA
jgi:hypothetical protein